MKKLIVLFAAFLSMGWLVAMGAFWFGLAYIVVRTAMSMLRQSGWTLAFCLMLAFGAQAADLHVHIPNAKVEIIDYGFGDMLLATVAAPMEGDQGFAFAVAPYDTEETLKGSLIMEVIEFDPIGRRIVWGCWFPPNTYIDIWRPTSLAGWL